MFALVQHGSVTQSSMGVQKQYGSESQSRAAVALALTGPAPTVVYPTASANASSNAAP